LALFLVAIFDKVHEDKVDTASRAGIIFAFVTIVGFTSLANVMMVFPDERPVFLREINNNMYFFFGGISYFNVVHFMLIVNI
jgi:hypothetical protein